MSNACLPAVVAAPGKPSGARCAIASDPVAAAAAMLAMLADAVPPQRRIVRAGEVIYRAGEPFRALHVLNSGFMKIVKPTADGREQLVGLRFRGDWLGFDGIDRGTYGCDAVAMDTGEVWSVDYDALMTACADRPALLASFLRAMSRDLSRDREALMSICTLPADARVADFLRNFIVSAGRRGLRTDQVTLRLTRAEIGNYLGLTLESVSRAFSKLVRGNVIAFCDKGRRDVRIPDLGALAAIVENALASSCATAG